MNKKIRDENKNFFIFGDIGTNTVRHIIWIFYGWIVEKCVKEDGKSLFIVSFSYPSDLLPLSFSYATFSFFLSIICNGKYKNENDGSFVLLKALMWGRRGTKIYFTHFEWNFDMFQDVWLWRIFFWESIFLYPLDNFISLTCFASLLGVSF